MVFDGPYCIVVASLIAHRMYNLPLPQFQCLLLRQFICLFHCLFRLSEIQRLMNQVGLGQGC